MTRATQRPRPCETEATPPPPATRAAVLVQPLLTREDLCAVLRCGTATLDRLRAAGRLPRPDLRIGRSPRWRPETIRRWIEEGGRHAS